MLDSVSTVDSATIEIFPALALTLRATSASVLQPRTTLIERSAPTATLAPAAVAEPWVSTGSWRRSSPTVRPRAGRGWRGR